jgi:hypothetical protein
MLSIKVAFGEMRFYFRELAIISQKTLFAFHTLVQRWFPGHSITLLAYSGFSRGEKGFIFWKGETFRDQLIFFKPNEEQK